MYSSAMHGASRQTNAVVAHGTAAAKAGALGPAKVVGLLLRLGTDKETVDSNRQKAADGVRPYDMLRSKQIICGGAQRVCELLLAFAVEPNRTGLAPSSLPQW